MKYRKKPVVIEAVQLLWQNWPDICDFAGVGKLEEGKPEGCYSDNNQSKLGLKIPTLEGVMEAVEGDYIIKGIKGELYPCKPDIFELTYEPIEEESQA